MLDTRTAPNLGASTSALQAARRRWWRRAGRSLLVLPAICIGIAAILTAIDGQGFGPKLVYALSIGAVCASTVDATRMLAAWLSDRLRTRRALPYSDDPAAGGWRGVLPGVLLSMVFGPPAGLKLADWITGMHSPSLLDLNSAGTRVTLAFSLVATAVSVVLLSTTERLAVAREQAQAAQRQAAENQLRLLQSQLEPHMLFNTLANLRVLIGLDPDRAQAMLDRLIAFLRATLSASRASSQALSTEFAQLDDYLALMAVRMGPRLQVRLDLPPELAGLPVPPLLLQPLVENSIKHGLEPKVAGGRIEVAARRDGGELSLSVRDTGVGLRAEAPTAGTGFGLEQVRQRLATLYGSGGTLSLQPAPGPDGGTLAVIRFPVQPIPAGLPT
jgi:signal transduction histidine kinase